MKKTLRTYLHKSCFEGLKSNLRGFTLVELLVTMSILGILLTLAGVSFRSSQIRGRDAKRKSDLAQIAKSLELFYTDYKQYPVSSSGLIQACAYNVATPGSSGNCAWGVGVMRDIDSSGTTNTTYFNLLPGDTTTGYSYYYRTVGTTRQKFQLYARLENSQDKDCLAGNCVAPTVPSGVTCGAGISCNYAVTSANASPTE